MCIDQTFLRDRFLTIDIRTLGLARIYMALLLLFDLAKRSAEMSVWYFESGLLPNAMLAEYPLKPWGHSLLFHVSSDAGVRMAFVLIALVYLALLLGIFTRVAQVLALICVLSLQVRIDAVSNGGDFVFCNLMVWTMFLPLGSAFSIDARRASKAAQPRRSRVVSWAVLVVTVQLAIIYFFNAIQKNGETWLDGSAVYWLAHQERIVTGLGYWMREHLPLWVFQAFTYLSLVTEYLLPFLILSPWGRSWTRRAAIAGIWMLHLGIAAVANVGLFSFVMIAYSMFLVSPEDWERLHAKLRSWRPGDDSVLAAFTLPPSDAPSEIPNRLLRWATNTLLAVLVVAATSQVLVENWIVPDFLRHQQPKWIEATVMTLRLNQGWRMFAANAPRDDLWLVVDAETVDGRHIDPVNEVASRYADPSLRSIPPRLGQNYYWCDYTVRIKGFRRYHDGLRDWIFRRHERSGNPNDRIVSFRVYEISQLSPGPGEDEPRDVQVNLIMSKRR
jgi:hypothetical protein